MMSLFGIMGLRFLNLVSIELLILLGRLGLFTNLIEYIFTHTDMFKIFLLQLISCLGSMLIDISILRCSMKHWLGYAVVWDFLPLLGY